MMAETLVDKKACKECGAEVRPNTTFCYNCGKSLAEPESSSAWFGETLVMDNPEDHLVPPDTNAKTVVMEAPSVPADVKTAGDVTQNPTEAKTEVLEIDPVHHSIPVEGGMKTAAGMRRKPKTFQRKEVEVVWEAHENPPTLKFVLVTLVLVLFAVIVYFVAMQMK